MVRVVALTKTCDACPSQWEGRTDDGRHIYVRYRWGRLQIGVGATEEEAVERAVIGNEFVWALGETYDGYLDEWELREETRGYFEWPEHGGA